MADITFEGHTLRGAWSVQVDDNELAFAGELVCGPHDAAGNHIDVAEARLQSSRAFIDLVARAARTEGERS